ncbi:hypothetical protein KY084_00020 [Stakelama sp. CBK3Z-3]|uniref:Uncharacterized protein n=1 Tax=Stakelama flava TaxID=2860338 RepID=A0ABS6XGG3_9SPHN|nr:hypothetical protein [Stakelama flava]MBW4329262.1 hypothetical protein [Stakelama flava]
MAYIETIKPASAQDDIVVQALRCYCGNRNGPMLPVMTAFADAHHVGAHAVIALTSVFELAEACLGRPLVAEPETAKWLSDDEEAMLLLLASVGDVGSHCGSAAVPHGLPGALAWAVRTANRLCGRQCTDVLRERASCPFDS